MSDIKVYNGKWLVPSEAHVKHNGDWNTPVGIFAKDNGKWFEVNMFREIIISKDTLNVNLSNLLTDNGYRSGVVTVIVQATIGSSSSNSPALISGSLTAYEEVILIVTKYGRILGAGGAGGAGNSGGDDGFNGSNGGTALSNSFQNLTLINDGTITGGGGGGGGGGGFGGGDTYGCGGGGGGGRNGGRGGIGVGIAEDGRNGTETGGGQGGEGTPSIPSYSGGNGGAPGRGGSAGQGRGGRGGAAGQGIIGVQVNIKGTGEILGE